MTHSQLLASPKLPKETNLPEDICENVKQVTMRHPEGLSYQMFRRAYVDTTGSNLDVGQFGFNSLEAFFQHLITKKIIQLNYENNNIVVKPNDDLVKNISFLDPRSHRDGMYRPQRRADIIGPQDKIPQQGLPPDLKVDDFLEVIVAEVFNPNRFWIQLKGEVTSKSLEKLMDELENFYYGDEAEQFKVPDDEAVVGLICVSLYSDGNWHRAYIKSMIDLSTVEVFYLDYGTAAKVKKDTLHYLHRRFGELPGQAIEARLAGIKPEGGLRRFTRETSYRFLQLVKMPTDVVGLMAVVKGLGPKLTLWLVDTSTNHLPEGIAINQVLVDEGLAEPEVLEDDDPIPKQKKAVVNHLAPLRRPIFTQKSKSNDIGFSTVQTPIPPPSTNKQKTAIEEIQSKMAMLDSWVKSSKDPSILEQLKMLHQTQQEELENLNKDKKPQQEGEVYHSSSLPTPSFQSAKEKENIRPMNLSGYKVHMVVLNKAAWITSFQISLFVPNWKGRDILARMLKLKRMSVDSVLVTSESHPDLHKAMVEGGLGGLGCEVEELWMYPIKSIPHILNIFVPKPPRELKEELEKEIEKFDLTII